VSASDLSIAEEHAVRSWMHDRDEGDCAEWSANGDLDVCHAARLRVCHRGGTLWMVIVDQALSAVNNTTIAIRRARSFCWYGMLRPVVTKASNRGRLPQCRELSIAEHVPDVRHARPPHDAGDHFRRGQRVLLRAGKPGQALLRSDRRPLLRAVQNPQHLNVLIDLIHSDERQRREHQLACS